MKKIRYLEADEIKKIHSDLIAVSGGLLGWENGKSLEYIVNFCEKLVSENLEEVSAYLLARIAKGHPFIDGNKRTAYFSTKYFLMKNGADFDGRSIEDTSTEIGNIASSSNIASAYHLAREFVRKNLVFSGIIIPDYETFYRIVIKSIGMAKKLSE